MLKRAFARERPFAARVLAPVIGHRPGSHSFPSGHSAAGFAGAWLLSRHYPRWSPAFYLLALVVAFSRLYLGVHYLSDVVTGALAGTGLAVLFRAVASRLTRR